MSQTELNHTQLKLNFAYNFPLFQVLAGTNGDLNKRGVRMIMVNGHGWNRQGCAGIIPANYGVGNKTAILTTKIGILSAIFF